jgi:hypothetical protein
MISFKKYLAEMEASIVKEADGDPHDRGDADAYYGRKQEPHKYVNKPDGNRERVPLTDPEEIEQYTKGYMSGNSGRKDYGESEMDEVIMGPGDQPDPVGSAQQAQITTALAPGGAIDTGVKNSIAGVTNDNMPKTPAKEEEEEMEEALSHILRLAGIKGK